MSAYSTHKKFSAQFMTGGQKDYWLDYLKF